MSALSQLRTIVSKHMRLLTKTQREKVEDLIKNPSKARSAFLQRAPDTTSVVVGTLSTLKDGFEKDLAEAKEQEEKDKKAHEGLVKAKSEEIMAGKKQLEAKKEQKAAADLERAQAKQDIKDTTAALEADGSLSTVVKEKCAAMDVDYDKRSKLRSEEQTAVAKAIEVLSSDEAHDVFGKTLSFLQVGKDNEGAAKASALSLLAAVGKKKRDARLATLALTMKLDTFEKVKKAIDEMRAALKKEQEAEKKKKDWCTSQFQKKKLETQEKTHEEQTKIAEMESLQSSVSQLAGDIKLLEDEVAEMNKQLQVAGQNREKENKEFQKVVGEQRTTQVLLKEAMASLKSVYAKEAAFLQESTSKVAGAHGEEPEFKDFKQQSGSYGVLGMLQQLIGDSKAMEVEATHAESTAQEDYEAFTKGTTASVEAKTKDITDKDAEKGATEASLVEARQSKEGLTAELENLAAAVAELQDECDYMLKNFDARQSARDDEMEALQQAKSMLSGAKA